MSKRTPITVLFLAAIAFSSGCDSASTVRYNGDAAAVPADALSPGQPYPFATPAPPRDATAIDGEYVRRVTVEQAGGKPVYCARCAPYRLDAGVTTLVFDRGRFFVDFRPMGTKRPCEVCKKPPGFKSSGHYIVAGDRITFFNDPNCTDARGTYRWQLDDGELMLAAIEDECAFLQLRAKFLTAFPWKQS